jgi:chaperonin cofactor prefoldin
MSEEDRIGTIDLIIDVLREHERTFDSLFNHLDSSIDRMDMQRIEAKLKTEKEENEKIETLVDRIAELENRIEKYKERIEKLEKQIIRIKNNSHK